jgi:hypothetical protein
MHDMTMAQAVGEEPFPPLAFDGHDMADYGPDGPDEDDVAAMNEAMDRNMRERESVRVYELEARVEALEAELAEARGERA